MTATILDGKNLSQIIVKKLRKEISSFIKKPSLAIVQVGNLPQSNSYINRKKNFGAEIGATVHHIILPEIISQKKLIECVDELNKRKDIDGIIVQLPIPKHLDKHEVLEAIDPKKDVDGLHSINSALLYESASGGQDPKNIPKGLLPATAKGILTLLKHYKIPLVGKKALVIGKSLLVGKPVSMLLLKEDATITIAHSKTVDLDKLCRENEIIISAAGRAGLVGKKALKKGQVIVDVGTNAVAGPKTLEELPKMKLVGDVDFEAAKKIVSAISPVPGGVGPMTVASLFENLVQAYKAKK